jgi:hypothetical protein
LRSEDVVVLLGDERVSSRPVLFSDAIGLMKREAGLGAYLSLEVEMFKYSVEPCGTVPFLVL